MQVYKEGIETTIKDKEWAEYSKRGYIQVNKKEPQPIQEDIKPVEEFIVRKAPVKKKKGTKKGV